MTQPIQTQQHISDYPDALSEQTRILLDRSSAEWALYCLMTGDHARAKEHLARIRPRTLPQVLDAATRLVDLVKQTAGHQ